MVLGAFEQAEEGLTRALADCERLDLAHLAAVARHNLGLVVAMRGRVAEGLAHERAALAAFEHQGERRLLSAAHRYVARILLLGGDFVGAEREARVALTHALDTGPGRVEVLAILARVLIALGRTLEARAVALEGVRELETLGGSVEEEEAELRLALAEAHEAEGDPASARAVLARAKERLLARASRIHDPELRRSFLGIVQPNVRTLALAEQWGI
jgi:hypothetical protein